MWGTEEWRQEEKTPDVKTSAYHVGPALTKVISVFPAYLREIIHRLRGGGAGGRRGGEGERMEGALLPAEKPKWRGCNRHVKKKKI